ncbi:MAG: hypothetical protein MUC50_07320 [Myxococcota bacterium]|nr:hypothetical protein [Myxococcota bacterium]
MPIGCNTVTACDFSSCQVNGGTGISECRYTINTGDACDDATTGINNGYDNLYPVCGAYVCEDNGAGRGLCVDRPFAGVHNLECVSNADDCKVRLCNVDGPTNTYTCDYEIAVGSSCSVVVDPCDVYECDATHTCAMVSSFPPGTVDATAETCAGLSIGAVAAAAITRDDDNACRDNDASPEVTDRFSECNITDQSDLVFSFTDQTDTDLFQLRHRRVTVQAQNAGANGYSEVHDWDPLLYVRSHSQWEASACAGAAGSQYTCNNNCFNGFNPTNMSATACTGLDAVQDSAVTTGPWPLEDFPASNVANYLTTTSTRTNYTWVDSSNAATPPGGEFRLTVTPEDHNNNDCRNTGAYVAAPLIKGQESWKDRFRGTTTGYTNYNFGKSPSNGPTCWGGGAAGAADPKGAFFTVDLEEGNDDMGAGQEPWPHNYKIYLDPANTSNAFNPVLSFWGSGSPDGDNNCLAGLGTQSACYPDGATVAALKPYVTREHVVRSSDATFGAQQRRGWLEVSNYTAGQSGQYELSILRAPRPFANLGQVFRGGTGTACTCASAADDPPNNFRLEGYRLDFLPSNDHATGFIVTATSMGASWLVDPSWAEGSTNGTTYIIKKDELCRGVNCKTWAAGMLPFSMGFAFPYSGEFWSHFCVDTAGRVELGKPQNPASPDAFSGNGYTCRNVYEPNAGSLTEQGTWTIPNDTSWPAALRGSAAEGYAPSIAPLWSAIIPCWNANQSSDVWDLAACRSTVSYSVALCNTLTGPGQACRGPMQCADDPSTWRAGCRTATAVSTSSDGVITSELIQFEGTLARVVTWDGMRRSSSRSSSAPMVASPSRTKCRKRPYITPPPSFGTGSETTMAGSSARAARAPRPAPPPTTIATARSTSMVFIVRWSLTLLRSMGRSSTFYQPATTACRTTTRLRLLTLASNARQVG